MSEYGQNELDGRMKPRVDPPPPRYACATCGVGYDDRAEFESHLWNGHSVPAPALLLDESDVSHRQRITRHTEPASWELLNSDTTLLDERAVEFAEAVACLSTERDDVHTVTLRNGGLEARYHLDFCIPDVDEIARIDRLAHELLLGGRLDADAVRRFIDECAPHGPARTYVDGVAQYFYGRLARERRRASTEEHRRGVDQLADAATTLGGFDTELARTIGAVTAFHFNHYTDAVQRGSGTTVGSAADILARWLVGDTPGPSSVGQGVDRLLADATSVRVAELVIGIARGQTDAAAEAQAMLDSSPPSDRLKLAIALAERAIHSGQNDDARRIVKSLPVTSGPVGEWKTSVRRRTRGTNE